MPEKYDISITLDFLRCPHCNKIFKDLSLTEIGKKCPNCEKLGPRMLFPGEITAYKVLQMMQSSIIGAEAKYKELMNDLIGMMKKYTKELGTPESMETLFKELENEAVSFDNQIKYVQEKFSLSYDKAIEFLVVLTEEERTNISHRFAVILAITLFESLISNFFKDLIEKCGGTYKLAQDVINVLAISSYSSYQAYVKLFKELTNESFEKEMQSINGGRDYHEKLESLRKKRNSFVHGRNIWAINKDDTKIAFDFALKSFDIFAELNNKFCVKATA